MKGGVSHHNKGIKICKVCGLIDSDQNTCMNCRRKIAKQRKGVKS